MKRIAWVKYTGSIEVGDGLLFTTGTTDLRTELFRALIKAGVEIVLYSTISRESKAFLESPAGQKDFGNKIKVVKTDRIQDDVDFLVVESGPDNARFDTTLNGVKMPQISYCNQLIQNYKGLLFYMQIDLALPFTFFPEFLSMEYASNFLKYGNFLSLLQNKTFVVITPTKKIKEFVNHQQKCARNRYGDLYEYGAVKFDTYEFHYCGIYGLDEFKIKSKTDKKVTYVGGERARLQKFKKYYASLVPDIEVDVWGKWSESTQQRLPDVNWRGVLGKGLSKQVYNESVASIIIGDINYEKLDIVSGRFFEVVTAKTVPLIDIHLKDTTISDIFDDKLLDELIVKDRDSIVKKINKLHNSGERVNLIMQCLKQLKQFSPHTSVQMLHDLWLKYKDLDHGKGVGSKAVNSFLDLIEEREQDKLFSKSYYHNVLRKVYSTNNITGREFDENAANSVKDFRLRYEDFKPLDVKYVTRCFKCGDDLPPKEHKSASRMVCDTCKEDTDKNIFKRMRVNLKKYKNL